MTATSLRWSHSTNCSTQVAKIPHKVMTSVSVEAGVLQQVGLKPDAASTRHVYSNESVPSLLDEGSDKKKRKKEKELNNFINTLSSHKL